MQSVKYKSAKKLHPTDKELANFIDNRLSPQKRKRLLSHLIYCDRCTHIIIGTILNSKKK